MFKYLIHFLWRLLLLSKFNTKVTGLEYTPTLQTAIELYNLGVEYSKNNDINNAIIAYLEALKYAPDLYTAHQNLGVLYDKIGNYPLSKQYHMNSIYYAESKEFKVTSLANLMNLYMNNHLLKQMEYQQDSLWIIETILQLNIKDESYNINAAFAVGCYYNYIGEYEKALSVFLEVYEYNPNHMNAIMNIGNYYFRLHQYDKTIYYYTQALQVLSDTTTTISTSSSLSSSSTGLSMSSLMDKIVLLNNLGQVYRQLDKHSLAYNIFLEAMSDSNLQYTQNPKYITFETYIWSIVNVYIMQGISSYWGNHYELREYDIEQFIENSSSSIHSLTSSGSSITSQKTSQKSPYKTPCIDPYTLSLTTYTSFYTDYIGCQLCCPIQPNLSFRQYYRHDLDDVIHSNNTLDAINVHDSVTMDYNNNNNKDDSEFIQQQQQQPQEQQQQGRLRIGYISYDWRDHPMGRLTRRLVTSHDITYFNTSCLSYATEKSSSIYSYVLTHCPYFLDISTQTNDHSVAQYINQYEQYHILLDITSHTFNNRLNIAAYKPAPIVINYLGFPGVTACNGFDYTLVDHKVIPPEVMLPHTIEKLIYLPYQYQVNDMPLTVPPCIHRDICLQYGILDDIITSINMDYDSFLEGSTAATKSMSYKNHIPTINATDISIDYLHYHHNGYNSDNSDNSNISNLRDQNMSSFNILSAHVFTSSMSIADTFNTSYIRLCSFNNNKKYESHIFHIWMNILHRLPYSYLFLMVHDLEIQVNLIMEARYYGIPSHRIKWLSKKKWEDHLYRATACDLLLDTFIYGAHTTSSDVLWMWMPIISLESYGSDRMPSRVSASIIQSLFSFDFIPDNQDDDTTSHVKNSGRNRYGFDSSNLMIVHTVKEYENNIIRLCQQISYLQQLKYSVGKYSIYSPTFHAPTIQKNIESSLQSTWDIYTLIHHHHRHHRDHNNNNNNNNNNNEFDTSNNSPEGTGVISDRYHIIVGSTVDHTLDTLISSISRSMSQDFKSPHISLLKSSLLSDVDDIELNHFQVYMTSICGRDSICNEAHTNITMKIQQPSDNSTSDFIKNSSYLSNALTTNAEWSLVNRILSAFPQSYLSKQLRKWNIFHTQLKSLRQRHYRWKQYHPSSTLWDENNNAHEKSSSSDSSSSDCSSHTHNETDLNDDTFRTTIQNEATNSKFTHDIDDTNISMDILKVAPVSINEHINTNTFDYSCSNITQEILLSRIHNLDNNHTEWLICSNLLMSSLNISVFPNASLHQLTDLLELVTSQVIHDTIMTSSHLHVLYNTLYVPLSRLVLDRYSKLIHVHDGSHIESTHSSDIISVVEMLKSVHTRTHLSHPMINTKEIHDVLVSSHMIDTQDSPYMSTEAFSQILQDLSTYNPLYLKTDTHDNIEIQVSSVQIPKTLNLLQYVCDGCYMRNDDGATVQFTMTAQLIWYRLLNSIAILLTHMSLIHMRLFGTSSFSSSSSTMSPSESVTVNATETPSPSIAALLVTSAYFIDPTNDRLKNMGILWKDSGAVDIGYHILMHAVTLEHQYRYHTSPYNQDFEISPYIHRELRVNNNCKTIAIYCHEYGNDWWPHWSISSLMNGKGLGGSEEAVVYMAYELSQLGYDIEIYADPSIEDISRYTSNDDNDTKTSEKDNNGIECTIGQIRTYHYTQFNMNISYDVFIGWRYSISMLLGQLSHRKYLWLHDLVTSDMLPYYLSTLVDDVLIQSEFHHTQLYTQAKLSSYGSDALNHLKFIIIPNGVMLDFNVTLLNEMTTLSTYISMNSHQEYSNHPIIVNPTSIDMSNVRVHDTHTTNLDLETRSEVHVEDNDGHHNAMNENIHNDDVSVMRHPYQFMYASSPNRGLEAVLRVWSHIRQYIPSATLYIYYGFSPAIDKQLSSTMGGTTQYIVWKNNILQLLQQQGIQYIGTVDHKQLKEALLSSSYLLYPTSFPETGCITVLKAMCYGTIPITSRYTHSVLYNLSVHYDYGPQRVLTSDISDNYTLFQAWLQNDWLPAIFNITNKSIDEIELHRSQMMQYAKNTFTWKNSAKLLSSYFT